MIFPALATLSGVTPPPALCRIVAKAALDSLVPADYLYASGRPGRYNLRGTHCVYASEELVTAATEYTRYNAGDTKQAVVYWFYPNGPVIDLGDVAVLGAL